jgi:hypothetical protein
LPSDPSDRRRRRSRPLTTTLVPTTPRPDGTTPQPDWPLVGRERELQVLRDLLEQGPPAAVVLAGPLGVGKTRLAHECLAMAAASGMATERTVATHAASHIPFGALAPVLHATSPPGALDDRADVLRRSVAALADRPGGRRLVLLVDDAHLLDDASATLLHQVAAARSVTVLATVRSGEPAPDPIVALWKDGLASRIELGGLDHDATEELLTTVLGGPVDPATARQLVDRCQGNALFLRELVLGALDDGTLVDDGVLWRLVGDLSPSDRLVEIVEGRLGRLTDEERALMELVSHGEPLGQAELDALSDRAVADALERRGLLTTRFDGRRLQVSLAHPVYGDVVRARTPALRARAIAESLAGVIEQAPPRRHDDVLRIAAWRLTAGGGDPRLLLEGATIARWRYDFPLAERLARAAGEAGAGFDAELLAAHVASLQGRRQEAEAALAELAGRCRDDRQHGMVAVARFDNLATWSGCERDDLLDDALRRVGDTDVIDQLEARRLWALLDRHGPRVAAEAAQTLADRSRGEALVVACLVGALCLTRLGHLDAAIEMSERGREAREGIDSPLAWNPGGTR